MDRQDTVINMRITREVATLFGRLMDNAILARTTCHMDSLRVSTNPDNKVDDNTVQGVGE
jgi:hypothetical protein